MLMLLTIKLWGIKTCMNWNEQIHYWRDIKWSELRCISCGNDNNN